MATVTSSMTASLRWNPPDSNLQNGIIVYYTLVLTDLTFGTRDSAYNTSHVFFNLNGLEEYSRYSFQVSAATVVGSGPLSSPTEFTTFEDSE